MKIHTKGEFIHGYYLRLHDILPNTLELVYYSKDNEPILEDIITIQELLKHGKNMPYLSIGRYVNKHLGSEVDYYLCSDAFEAIINYIESNNN